MKSDLPRSTPHPRIDVSGLADQWLAMDPQSYDIAGHDPSPTRATEMAKEAGVEDPLLYFVPKSDAYFVGAGA